MSQLQPLISMAHGNSRTSPTMIKVGTKISLFQAGIRCGFAQSQEAHDVAVNGLFCTLDRIDDHLGSSQYFCRDRLTLADICLFTTLIKFDLVYNVLFKCTKKMLLEFANLHGYMRNIY
ncbi:hypothetical protein REPUB_Repub17cG0072800 [Reevesia pubescens]